MNITALYNDCSALSLAQIYGTQSTDSESSDTTQTIGTSVSASSLADSLDLSKPAELYSKLQQLAESDPEKLKEVCADIADKLNSAAGETTGSEATMLSDLAEKFESVAEGGDLSQLQPPPPPPGGSPPSGAQGVADLYSEQSDQNQTSTLDDLLAGFIDEVDQALL